MLKLSAYIDLIIGAPMQPSKPMRIPEFGTRQIVYATLLVVMITGLFFFLYRYTDVVLILLGAILLSTAIKPAVEWFNRRGIPRASGVILLYAGGLALVAILCIAILPMLSEQITEIYRDLPELYKSVRDGLFLSGNRLLYEIAFQLPPEFGQGPMIEAAAGEGIEPAAQTLPIMDLIIGNIVTFVAVFILAFYWTLESERSIYFLLLWIPQQRREKIRGIVNELEEKVGQFLLGQGVLALIVGSCAFVAYILIGLPYALALGIIAGIMEVIPLVGPALGAIPAIVVALSFDPIKIIWVVLAATIIQVLENYLLVPRVMKQSVGVSPFVILLSLTAFSSLLGFAGGVLAIPIAAILQVLFDRFVFTDGNITPTGRGRLSLLRYKTHLLAQDIRKQFRESRHEAGESGEILEKLEGTIYRLDRLLAAQQEKRSAE